MDFNMWTASVPVFVNTLTDMRAWLDKVTAQKDEAVLLEARLAPDMKPLPAQYQMASDSAKNTLARLTGTGLRTGSLVAAPQRKQYLFFSIHFHPRHCAV